MNADLLANVSFRAPDNDRRPPRVPSHPQTRVKAERRACANHLRVMEERSGLAGGTTGRIHASRKTETRSDISWMQMGLQQAAIDDRQIGPDAPELVGVLNAGGFPPLRKRIFPPSKILNLRLKTLLQP